MQRIAVMHDDMGLFTGPPAAQLYDSLEGVLAALGPEPARVVVAGPLSASISQEVPVNVTLEFTGEGSLVAAEGATVSILGHVFAPARQIFSGAGTVVFSSSSCLIFPGWWGGGEGASIGRLTSDEVAVVNLQAGLLTASQVAAGQVQATTVSASGSITSGSRVTAVEVYEGTRRVGTDRVARAGDTMTGPLYLLRYPEQSMEAAPRGYVLDVVQALAQAVQRDNGFGVVVLGNGSESVRAVVPMDVISFVDGFGMTLTKGTSLMIVEEGDTPQFYVQDDPGLAAQIGEPNGLVLACAEVPGESTLAAADTISSTKRTLRVQGDSAPVSMTSDPQVAAGSFDGQPIFIVGSDDTNTVTLVHGAGLALAGGASVTLGKGDSVALRWDENDTTWREVSRSIL